MKILTLLSILTIVPSSLISQTLRQQAAGAVSNVGVDVLSDTNGADISPYMRTVISEVKEHWTPPADQATNHGSRKAAGTVITFSITPEGHVQTMSLMQPTNPDFDRAAWSAVVNASFPALPLAIHGEPLKLRISFPAR